MPEVENTPVAPNGKFQFREKIVAMLCLTAMAGGALCKMSDPENILINVIVAIAALVNVAGGRKTDDHK